MKLTSDMINSEIRFSGRIKGMFMNLLFSGETTLRMTRGLAKTVLKRNRSHKLNCEEVIIVKKSGGKVRTRIYQSLHPEKNAVGLLWLHGGGYAIGAPEMDVGYIEKLIAAANCIVVSPDYTLSTEKPYPAALEDCYEALVWLKENTLNLGVRNDQIFVGGVSAGGGLTIAVTLMARDKGEVNIAFQMPLYPMIDDRMNTMSAINNNAPIWNSKSNRLGWKMYLRELFGKDYVPKYAAPARELDCSNLPPAYTFVGDIEPFYNETIAYFDSLKNAGISAKADVYAGCCHAFEIMCPKASISKQAVNRVLEEFKYAAGNYFLEQNMNKHCD